MHAIVRGRVSRNVDYHTQMAEYYAGFQNEAKAASGPTTDRHPDAHEDARRPPPTPPEGPSPGNGRRGRGATPTTTAPVVTPLCPYNDEQLAKLVAMHTGAAEQLAAILANEKPQQILAERAKPPVTRKTGAPGSLRIH